MKVRKLRIKKFSNIGTRTKITMMRAARIWVFFEISNNRLKWSFIIVSTWRGVSTLANVFQRVVFVADGVTK
jgi:hypothetical protein